MPAIWERPQIDAPRSRSALLGLAALLAVAAQVGRLADRWFAVPAAALALAALTAGGVPTLRRAPTPTPRRVGRAVLSVLVAWAIVRVIVAAFSTPSTSPKQLVADVVTSGWFHRGAVGSSWMRVAPIAVIVWIALARGRPRRAGALPTHEPSRWTLISLTAIAALAWIPGVLELVSRQYVERISTSLAGRRTYVGPLVPLLLWTTAITGCLAALTAIVLVVPLARWTGARLNARPAPRTLIVGVVSASFVWRLVALLTIAPARTDGGDPLYYHTQANTLAKGLGFIEPLNWIAFGRTLPTALHGPGYPLYLALFSRVGASAWFDHRLASSLIGTGSVLLAILLTRRLAGNVAALLAGAFACFYPNLWTIDGVLFPEGLFIFCCGVAMLSAYRWHDQRRPIDAVVLGVAIGAAALTRGEGIFLLVLLALPLCWITLRGSRRAMLRALAIIVVAAFAVMGPWMVRNATTFAHFVPLSTNGNELHVYSNCDTTYSGPLLGFWSYQCQVRLRDTNGDGVADFDPPGDESQQKNYWQGVGFHYARTHLGQVPKVVAARVLRQWDLFRPLQNAKLAFIEGRSPKWARIALSNYVALVGASFFGVRSLRRRKVMLLPLVAQFAAVTLTAAYAYGTTRFRAPAELALCVLAGVGVAPLARRLVSAARQPVDRDELVVPVSPTPSLQPTGRRRLTWRSLFPYGPALAAIALATRGLFVHPGAAMEEGFMLVFPERVLKGAVPNVDFLHLYGPASLHVLAAAYKVFGVSLNVARSVGLIYNTATVLALVTLARLWGKVTATMCGLVGVLVVFTADGLTPLAWNGAVALALWSLIVALRRTRWSPLWAALLAGLALSFRPDLVLALGLAHGARWWLDRHRSAAQRGDAGAWWWAAAGFVVGCTSLIVLLVQAGVSATWNGMVIDPVFRLRAGRTLPHPPHWYQTDGALQYIAEHPAARWPFPSLGAALQLFVWFIALPTMSIGGVLLAIRWVRRSTDFNIGRARLLVVAGAFGVGLLTQALQRPDSTHLLWGSVIAFPMAGCWLREAWLRRGATAPATRGSRLLTAIAPIVVLFVVLPFFTFRTYALHVRQTIGARLGGVGPGLVLERGGRTFRFGAIPPWVASQQIVADLSQRATRGERLFVGPIDLRATPYSDAYFYYLFPELTPATRYIEMDPGVADANDSGLSGDVAGADWLILTRFWAGWREPNTSETFHSDVPNQVVEQQFCLVASYDHDRARLYHHCPSGGAPGPYAGPYDPAYDYAIASRVPVPPRPDGTHPPGSPFTP